MGSTAAGPALSADALARLAAEAVRDGPGSTADTRLRAIRDQRVLEGLAVAGDAPWAAALAREWATARQEALDLLAIHAERDGRIHTEADEVLDAFALQLLTDPDAPGRLRRRLRDALVGLEPPPWFAAALAPEARVGRLLAAALLLPQVQAAPTAATTERIPKVEAPSAGAAGPVAAAAGHRAASHERSRIGAALVAPALALTVAAAGLRWPAMTALAVLLWLVLDRVVSFLADPFLRLVGGWPPRIRGWSVVWLPFRLVGVLLRGPWRLLGDLLLVVLWGLAVDRALRWLHPLLAGVADGVAALDPAGFTARWFVPVAAAGIVWQVTRHRHGRPSLRGAAAVGGLLRSLPAGAGGLLLVPAAALLVIAAGAPAEQPWAPYADHREAVAAWVPAARWWETGSAWVSERTDRLPGVADGLGDLLPGDDAATPRWQVVDATALNLRAGPGTDAPVVDTLARGTVVEGTGETLQVDGALWVEVRRQEGGTGWAAARFLEQLEP